VRIQGVSAGFDTSIVDRIMDGERGPVNAAKDRRGRVVAEKNEYSALNGLLGELGNAVNGLKLPGTFRQLQVESSHPDILSGVVDGNAVPGSYEMEVRGLASADKHLEFGFPDRDKSPVGFGFMQIEREGGKASDVIIKPGATLNDVANTINASGAGVRASIVNTGLAEDPFKLMVVSEATGEAAKIHLDPDTTYMDFKHIKPARNLDLNFEDIGVTRPTNKLDDLIAGVKLDAKRAEPGTRVTVNIAHDLDRTLGNIKTFTEKYNTVARFLNSQFQVDSGSKRVDGKLAGDGNVRQMLRSLQTQMAMPSLSGDGKYHSLAEVGVTTNAKTGELQVDEAKLKGALAGDYEGVSKLFTVSESGEGVAARVAKAIDGFKDPVSGVLADKMRGLDSMIKDQDQQIERQTRRLDDRREALERQFSAMQGRVDALNNQGEFLAARLGGASEIPQAAPGGGPGKQNP
jgi:flagellar hook-associated protein 2